MTTNATIGYGTPFYIKDTSASPDVFVVVGEVTSITPPNFTRDTVDVTHTESNNGWREFIPGLKDAGETKIEGNYVFSSNTDDLILAQFNTTTLTQCKIQYNGNSSQTATFSGIVTGYEKTAPVDDKMGFTLTVKVTGEVTFAG
jgi:predicted secreted protein